MPSIDALAILSSQATSFDTGDVITVNAASGAVYDATTGRNLGLGEEVKVIAAVMTTLADSGGSGTVTVAIQTSPDNSTWTTQQSLPVIPASSVAGTTVEAFLAPDVINARYIRAYYTVGNTLTAGAVAVWLGDQFQDTTPYPVGTVIAGN